MVQNQTQDSYYRSDSKYVLTKKAFDRSWREIFESIFKPKGTPSRPRWLPRPLFNSDFCYCFITEFGSYSFKKEYQLLQQALGILGESSFVIIGAEKQFQTRKDEIMLKYDADSSWKEYTQGRDLSTFFLVVQPTELYLHGQRDDWGIVASEDLGIAIVGYRGKKASRVFRERFITDPQIIRQEHLSSAPDDYSAAFEHNYMNSVL